MASARILIADDHEAARAAIRSELHRHHDLTVCGEASNGEEAIQQALSLNPDLIILDVMMPAAPSSNIPHFGHMPDKR
jgi:DNA-binding NarL/FixJ family response regulator